MTFETTETHLIITDDKTGDVYEANRVLLVVVIIICYAIFS